jgi:hypothetical protein
MDRGDGVDAPDGHTYGPRRGLTDGRTYIYVTFLDSVGIRS